MAIDRLIFGCQSITGGSSFKRSLRILECAIDHGIASFDVAPSYGLGTAEEVIGRVAEKRPQILVSTKVGIEPPAYGRFMALAREPYRHLVKLLGSKNGQYQRRGINAADAVVPRSPDVLNSFQRSIAALGKSRIDTWLAHEALSKPALEAFALLSGKAIAAGTVRSRGFSGERASIDWNCQISDLAPAVIQCSLYDARYFADVESPRLFGIVSTIAPMVHELCASDAEYAEALADCLRERELSNQSVFVTAVAIALTLRPRASIILSTSNENTLKRTVEALSDSAMKAWSERYKSRHEALIWGTRQPANM